MNDCFDKRRGVRVHRARVMHALHLVLRGAGMRLKVGFAPGWDFIWHSGRRQSRYVLMLVGTACDLPRSAPAGMWRALTFLREFLWALRIFLRSTGACLCGLAAYECRRTSCFT